MASSRPSRHVMDAIIQRAIDAGPFSYVDIMRAMVVPFNWESRRTVITALHEYEKGKDGRKIKQLFYSVHRPKCDACGGPV